MQCARLTLGLAVSFALASFACGPGDVPASGTGGTAAGSGGAAAGTGGAAAGSGGVTSAGSGGSISAGTGGVVGSGGAGLNATGGVLGSGGVGATGTGSGGAPGSGGVGAGGAGTGGASGGPGGMTAGTGGAGTGGGTGGVGISVPLDPALLSHCTGTNPIRCTIPVPTNGDYNVTVELGSATASSTSRVQAELYRIVVQPLTLPAGTYSQQTFSVNVRPEVHDGYSAPGMVLDLLIDGAAPALHGVGFASAPSIPTIFAAGDSTVCDWDPALATILSPIERGWAQELSQYLKPGIAVANYADSGETASSFYGKFFPPAKAAMRAGDYLFVQFGHNDQKTPADISAYQSNLMKYISDARSKNVTPVLFTPVARKTASTASPGFAGLDQQVRDLAAAQNVALIDLTMLAIADYKTVANLSVLFATPTEGTHFSETGATEISGLVAKALKAGTLPLRDLVR